MSGLSAGVRPSLLAPFGNRSFRFMWPADLLTSWAFETETLILGWYVLVETRSVLALTVFGALQFTGTLVSPLFGVVGDRIGARNLLCLMRGFYGVQASCIMGFAALGVLTPVYVFAIGFCMGWVRPSDLAIRNTLVGSMMPPDQLMAAMLLRSSGDRFRGRVMGVRMLAVYGMPLGLLLAGVMIHQFGFAATATGYCAFGLAASFAIAWYWWRDIWPRGAPANLG
jgi:MFS family permease